MQAVCLLRYPMRIDFQVPACWSAQAAAAGNWLPSYTVLSTHQCPPALQVICWVLGEYGTCAGASAQSVIDKLAAIIDGQVGHPGTRLSKPVLLRHHSWNVLEASAAIASFAFCMP